MRYLEEAEFNSSHSLLPPGLITVLVRRKGEKTILQLLLENHDTFALRLVPSRNPQIGVCCHTYTRDDDDHSYHFP